MVLEILSQRNIKKKRSVHTVCVCACMYTSTDGLFITDENTKESMAEAIKFESKMLWKCNLHTLLNMKPCSYYHHHWELH